MRHEVRVLAYFTLLKLGCQEKVIAALERREPSDATWLLAAVCARFYEMSNDYGDEGQRAFDYFMQPDHLVRGEWVDFGDGEELDRKALVAWLDYARERVQALSRRWLTDLLAQAVVGDVVEILGTLEPRRTIRQAQAVGRAG